MRLARGRPAGAPPTPPGGGGRRKRVRRLGVALAYVPVVAYAAALLLPLYYVVISSFKTNQTIFLAPLEPPARLSFTAYGRAEALANLSGAIENSVLVSLGAELVALALSVLAAFGIARIPSRLSSVIEGLFGLGFLVPVMAVLVPTFLLAVFTGLLHSLLSLVLFYPATVLPLSIILLTQFMRTIPLEVEESATIDGATRLQVLRHIILPLSMPGLATIAILNIITFWNEYLFALILTDEGSRTVQVALPFLKEPQSVDFALLSAGIVITLVPVYAAYVVLQRRMQEALVAGAVKG